MEPEDDALVEQDVSREEMRSELEPDIKTSNRPVKGFGSRILSDPDECFKYNAWDHVEWGQDQIAVAQDRILTQAQTEMSEKEKSKYAADPASFWDKFYTKNTDRFFKNRNWLMTEFPILHELCQPESGQKTILEVGCGAGNTIFPLLAENKNPLLKIYATDYSAKAVEIVKASYLYNEKHASALVWDLADRRGPPPEIHSHSIDVLSLIFVFSALDPSQWDQALDNVHHLLKPGGSVIFRDYGRYDMAQLRFKPGRQLSTNQYVRGDGTRVYFFTNEELGTLFGRRFAIEQNAVDRRLILNRLRKLQMYRVWVQGLFRKL